MSLSDRIASHEVTPRSVRVVLFVFVAAFTFGVAGWLFAATGTAGILVAGTVFAVAAAVVAGKMAAPRMCLLPDRMPIRTPATVRMAGATCGSVVVLAVGFLVSSAIMSGAPVAAVDVGVGAVVASESCAGDPTGGTPVDDPAVFDDGAAAGSGWSYTVEWVNGAGETATTETGCVTGEFGVGDRVGVRVDGEDVTLGDVIEVQADLVATADAARRAELEATLVVSLAAGAAGVLLTGLFPMRGEAVTLDGKKLGKVEYAQVEVPELRSRRKAGPVAGVPAGWYPDPLNKGQLRYFDGANWTTHTHR